MRDKYSSTERLGVNAVEGIVINELGWIFREQPIFDIGIAAQIEQVRCKFPTGKLIGLQIKTGKSHFRFKEDRLIYYGDLEHANYWLNYSLPVLIIAHIPEESKTYWQIVNKSTITYTKTSWRIDIPIMNDFSEESLPALEEYLSQTPEQKKLEKLFFDKDLIEHIYNGGKINV